MNSLSDEPLILPLDSPDAVLDRVGGKGASLARLAAARLPVPPGFHLTTHAYRRFVAENNLSQAILSATAQVDVSDLAALERVAASIQAWMSQGVVPADIAEAIGRAYTVLGAPDLPVAVRSSATAEDLSEISFAGQHETALNVRGTENLLAAIKNCWASLWTARAIGYRTRQSIRADEVALAVVVQELAPADTAGILFTANPVTGARDQLVINAAWGLGEAIVSGLVTPDTFTVNKQTGTIETQQIANKEVMTVRGAQGTRDEPVPTDRRYQAALQPSQIADLARLGVRIEKIYGLPMDIEWAFCGERIFILQARPITALPEPPLALDWILPHTDGRYYRTSIIELLPDPLSPLFATMALPLWTEAGRDLLKQMGLTDLLPAMPLITINGYAYCEYRLHGLRQARMLIGLAMRWRHLVSWLGRAQARWEEEAYPRYVRVLSAWKSCDLQSTSAANLLEGAREIAAATANHYVMVQSGILPVAYTSETLFTGIYNRFLKRKGDPPAVNLMLGFDSAPIQAEKSLYELAEWAREQPELADYLARTPTAGIVADYFSPASSAPIANADLWREFCSRFGDHLDRFGHAIYDLDFAKSLAADEPTPLFETLKHFLTGAARNPFERQAAAAAAREDATRNLLVRWNGIRRRWLSRLLRWAQRYAPLREDALATVGLGWPLLRRMLLEIGRRLTLAGSIDDQDDVFWLELDEVAAAARALDADQPRAELRPSVAARRAIWERERKITPPAALPVREAMRFCGIDISSTMPARTAQAAGNTIRGQGASPGYVTGQASVIHGVHEFDQMRPGRILVARITTPAWTPLFAIASGVVTDVGGPLSHGSIVAREYHIPAVLGTGIATERIRTGQQIVVDGDDGTVTIEAEA